MTRRLLLIAALSACGGAQTVQAPVDVAVAPVTGGALTVAGGERGGDCSLRLTAEPIKKSGSSCYVDEQISSGSGLLRFACNGNGAADARFGDHHYTGEIKDGAVTLELSTELEWDDNCRWGTHAVVRGTVLHGVNPALGAIDWKYNDMVLRGQGCSGVCQASTKLLVTSLDSPEPKLAPQPDDD